MKSLVDDNNKPCDTDNDKLRGLVDRNFFTREQQPLVAEAVAEECAEGEEAGGYSLEELKGKMRKALRGTSNRSAPGPDGISYRFIKAVLDTKLGEEVVGEVAEPLRAGRIPEAWQNSKVVFIQKANKDHKTAKG